MMSSNVLLFSGRAFDVVSHHKIFMVIGLQRWKLHRGAGAESAPRPAVLDSKKPGLFRVKIGIKVLSDVL